MPLLMSTLACLPVPLAAAPGSNIISTYYSSDTSYVYMRQARLT